MAKTTEPNVVVDITNQSVENTNTDSKLYAKVRNVAGRPIEINFSNGSQRIDFRAIAYIDEERLKNDKTAKSQFDRFVSNGDLRVMKRNCKERS